MIPYTKKIVIMGTTGAGKTTFLKHFVPNFKGAEVKRNLHLEDSQQMNTFTLLDSKDFENSTTTTSMNAETVLFYTTHANQFEFTKFNQSVVQNETIDLLYPVLFIDVAGQERFGFMNTITIRGADAAILFADGSNVQSIDRISHYINLVREEEIRCERHIPIFVFVNKSDLKERGTYVGTSFLENISTTEEIEIYETTNKNMDTIIFPLRILLNMFRDIPYERTKLIATC